LIGQAHLGAQHGIFRDDAVVSYLRKIIDLCIGPNARFAQAGAIHAGIKAWISTLSSMTTRPVCGILTSRRYRLCEAESVGAMTTPYEAAHVANLTVLADRDMRVREKVFLPIFTPR